MHKKIAVFANGWNAENLHDYMEGITGYLPDDYADFFVFLGHDAYGIPERFIKAEATVYDLPDVKDYEGVIFFASGMNFAKVNERILAKCEKAGIPVICVGNKLKGAIYVYTDNYEGMKVLADHMIDVHGVKDILFVAGPKDNADSNDRLRAVADSCRAHGVSFGEDNVYYGNWDVFDSTEYIRSRYSHGEKLPDVIMCANDNTAVFVSFVLEEMGLFSPSDVLLTGFDGNESAKNFYPSLTTVKQPFLRMGSKSGECLQKLFAGEKQDDEYSIPCELTVGESCGCDTVNQSDIVRRAICRMTPRNAVYDEFRANRMRYMERAVIKAETYPDLGGCLREFFYESDGYEGNPFYIFIDPDLKKLGECELDDMPVYTMPDKLDMLVGKNGDRHYGAETISVADRLLPEYISEGKSHVYVFLPLYIDTYVCGYMVMGDNIDYFKKTVYANFKNALIGALDTFRKNLRVRALNQRLSILLRTDALTSIYNRAAYEERRQELRESHKEGILADTSVVMFDVNDLKMINDNYGHEEGDAYIKASCELICDHFGKENVYRIGGDEFAAILQGPDHEKAESCVARFKEQIARIAEEGSTTGYGLSVACGMAIYDDSVDDSPDDTIKRADDSMYADKRLIKEKRKSRG